MKFSQKERSFAQEKLTCLNASESDFLLLLLLSSFFDTRMDSMLFALVRSAADVSFLLLLLLRMGILVNQMDSISGQSRVPSSARSFGLQTNFIGTRHSNDWPSSSSSIMTTGPLWSIFLSTTCCASCAAVIRDTFDWLLLHCCLARAPPKMIHFVVAVVVVVIAVAVVVVARSIGSLSAFNPSSNQHKPSSSSSLKSKSNSKSAVRVTKLTLVNAV